MNILTVKKQENKLHGKFYCHAFQKLALRVYRKCVLLPENAFLKAEARVSKDFGENTIQYFLKHTIFLIRCH